MSLPSGQSIGCLLCQLVAAIFLLLNPVPCPATSPDIVIFISDDQSREDCSPYGAAAYRLPTSRSWPIVV